jgi:hypothetical protein
MKLIRALLAAIMVATSASFSHAAGNCSAKASQAWAASPTQKLTVEAYTDGPTCALAVVTLVIRNSKDEPLWFETSDTRYILSFSEQPKANARVMATTLKEWVKSDDRLQHTNALPEWKKGADAPVAAEFPFYVHDGITQQDYSQMRDAKLPMFCYVAGMESEACLVLTKEGTIVKIGSQSFPG